jgi:lipopolysaccharide export system protein LptA
MTRWQRRARLLIALFGVVFAVFLARQFKPADATPAPQPVVPTEPGAIIEMTGCRLQRVTLSREDVSIECDKQFTYADGSSRLLGVTLTFDEKNGEGRFTASGKEAIVAKDQSTIVLNGDVRLGSSEMRARIEHATFTKADNTVRGPGAVELMEGRTTVSGVGLVFDRDRDVLAILDQAVVRIEPEEKGGDATAITSGAATFARREHYRRFEKTVRIQRGAQVIESETAVARLREDGEHFEVFELHGGVGITTSNAAAGGLQASSGQEMKLWYGEDGLSIQQALITGDAAIRIAGGPGTTGGQIRAQSIDIAMAPDGVTPIALTGREAVQLVFPSEPGVAARGITSTNVDATGEPSRGLTRALFSTNVRYREGSGAGYREARSGTLDIGLRKGLSGFDEATFAHAVRFVEGKMAALAAAARYAFEKGTLELSGTEPDAVTPHVVNEQIAVDATRIDVTLEGPLVRARGNVKSELRPAQATLKPGEEAGDVKMPGMLKQDQPVIVVANVMDYDGPHAKGTYTGAARLFQGDTSIKGETISIDGRNGDLVASGGVTTTTVLREATRAKQKQSTHSIATARDLKYEEAIRRLTYTGDAHFSGSEGDMTAARIELYLTPSGDELDRAEAYDAVTLREQNRKTTGGRMTYSAAGEKYVVTGSPVAIVDECGRETVGRTLTFVRATDSILVDGNAEIRTQTTGGVRCPE